MLAIAAVCALAVGVGGFFALRGGSGSDDATVQYVTDGDDGTAYSFSQATTNVESAAAMHISMTMEAPGATMALTGAVDRASRRFSMDVDTTAVDDPFGFGEMQFGVIIDEPSSTMYASGEIFTSWYQFDTTWVSIVGDEMGADFDMDEWFDQPLDLATMFAGLDPVEQGIETIDGEQLKHYTVTIPMDQLLAEDPDALTGFGTTDLTGLESITYDVWVDADSRLRRVGMDIEVFGEPVVMDMRLDHLDEPLEIALPDPADVTDWATAMESSMWGDIDIGEYELDGDAWDDITVLQD